MSFRTVVISSRSKLDLSLNRMVVRDCREKKYVFMDDIDILIIENPAVSITGCLLSALVDKIQIEKDLRLRFILALYLGKVLKEIGFVSKILH